MLECCMLLGRTSNKSHCRGKRYKKTNISFAVHRIMQDTNIEYFAFQIDPKVRKQWLQDSCIKYIASNYVAKIPANKKAYHSCLLQFSFLRPSS